jgi:hypothetical protein
MVRNTPSDFPGPISDRCAQIEAQLRQEFGVTPGKERWIAWLGTAMALIGNIAGVLMMLLIMQLPLGTFDQRVPAALLAWPLVTIPLTIFLLKASERHLTRLISPHWATFETARRARWDAELEAYFRTLDAR